MHAACMRTAVCGTWSCLCRRWAGNVRAVLDSGPGAPAGLVKLTVEEAELQQARKGKEYFAVVSVGNQVWVYWGAVAQGLNLAAARSESCCDRAARGGAAFEARGAGLCTPS